MPASSIAIIPRAFSRKFWFLAFIITAPFTASADSGRVVPHSAQTLRGWGMSLAWEANDLYGGGRQAAEITDPQLQSRYMDLLYGDPSTRLTLGLNIARYNIGGGENPIYTSMRPDAQMEGFQTRPSAAFDWTRDAAQRRMLLEARSRGANIFEAFSNSPPFWMTISGSASGGTAPHQDNLQPSRRGDFVAYLTTVLAHFRDVEGVTFESVEPFNEPNLSWMKGGIQEGYSASPSTQSVIIPMLADRLKRNGLSTFVAGVDTNSVADGVEAIGKLSREALSTLGRLNTHDYHTQGNVDQLKQYKSLADTLGKSIWMSEVGCCFFDQGDGTKMWGALFMADAVRHDLRDLGAEAWIFWQPDWDVIAFDAAGGPPRPLKQFYALAQYTRFIRPGFQIISAEGARNSLAAYDRDTKRLVLVSTNWEKPTTNDIDLSAFGTLPSAVDIYRTTSDNTVNLQKATIPLSSNGHIIDLLPARSITTYVVDSISPVRDLRWN